MKRLSILQRFVQYFQVNKLSINTEKTKYIVYFPRRKKERCKTTNTNIIMENNVLEQVNSIKFLGVIINKTLNWEEHKQYVRRKIAKTIGIIYNCKNIMSEPELINMYKTFIQSNLLYAIEVWGHTVTSDSDILVKIQNRVLRIIFDCKRSEDAWHHSKNRIQNIKELYLKTVTRICLKHHYNQLPEHFSHCVLPPKNNDKGTNYKHNLRSNLHKPYNYRCVSYTQDNFKFTENCIKIWNEKPLDFKMKPYIISE